MRGSKLVAELEQAQKPADFAVRHVREVLAVRCSAEPFRSLFRGCVLGGAGSESDDSDNTEQPYANDGPDHFIRCEPVE